MNLLRFFRRGRSDDRRGAPPAVEAARRAKRARDHLARKRRSGRRRGEPLDAANEPEIAGEGRFDLDPAPRTPLAARPHATEPEPFQLTPPRTGRTPRTQPAPLPPTGVRERAARPGASPGALPASSPGPSPAPARAAVSRGGAGRPLAPVRPLPPLAAAAAALIALGLGFAAGRPLYERFGLPHAPFARVAVIGADVRAPESIARALLGHAGAPIDRIGRAQVEALVLADPWIESVASLRLPTGTLLVHVVERQAVARFQRSPESEIALVDPAGRSFLGNVEAGGALPLVAGAPGDDAPNDDAPLSPTALEIVAELRKHAGLSEDLAALTLHLPTGDADAPGYVLEIGRAGPRALLGETFLKRRIARLATLLAQRDALLAQASVIDLRYADRAVLRAEPTSG